MRAYLYPMAAVLAFTSVAHGGLFSSKPANAMANAQIDLVPFDSPNCSGFPQQPPLLLIQGHCYNFGEARSVKPMIRKESFKWIKEVNNSKMHCKLETFGEYNCNTDSQSMEYESGASSDQPGNLNKCLRPSLEFFETQLPHKTFAEKLAWTNKRVKRWYPVTPRFVRSARFKCGPVKNPEHLCTSTLLHTSWSIDPTLNGPVSEVQKVTYTGTLKATPHTEEPVPTAKATQRVQLAPRDGPVKGSVGDDESKGVWMLHPWVQSVMCYKCWPKKYDYRKIECRGGEPFPVDCGPMPPLPMEVNAVRPSITTSTATGITTIHSTTTRSLVKYTDTTQTVTEFVQGDDEKAQHFPDLGIELSQKRSWHMPVKFPNPFFKDKFVCADAEWEKRGQGSKSYIKLQHAHTCGDGDRADSRWLGFPLVVHAATLKETTSSLTVHTETSNSTATVGTTTTTVIRHDQL